MKVRLNNEGFSVLLASLLIVSLIGILIVTASTIGTSDLRARRLAQSRDDLALKIRNFGSMASALRYSTSTNPQLLTCAQGATCTAGGPYPLLLANPFYSVPQSYVGGPPPNGLLYDPLERQCGNIVPTPNSSCPLSVTTQFSIVCAGRQPSCSSSLASIQVYYVVQKAPGAVYPGVLAATGSPAPSPVPVPCITYAGPTALSSPAPQCY